MGRSGYAGFEGPKVQPSESGSEGVPGGEPRGAGYFN